MKIRLLIISSILFLVSCYNSQKVEINRIDAIKRQYQQEKLTEQEYRFLLEAEKNLKQIKELNNE